MAVSLSEHSISYPEMADASIIPARNSARDSASQVLAASRNLWLLLLELDLEIEIEEEELGVVPESDPELKSDSESETEPYVEDEESTEEPTVDSSKKEIRYWYNFSPLASFSRSFGMTTETMPRTSQRSILRRTRSTVDTSIGLVFITEKFRPFFLSELPQQAINP